MAWRELLPSRGCDEWHNRSWYVVWPIVGQWCWFPKANRSGPEHLHASGPEGTEGYIDPTCDICAEILAVFRAEPS